MPHKLIQNGFATGNSKSFMFYLHPKNKTIYDVILKKGIRII